MMIEPANGAPMDENDSAKRQFLDELRTSTPTAFATLLIIVVNVAVFVVMTARGANVVAPDVLDLRTWGANYGPLTSGGEPWRLFTSMFLHVGVIHLAFNMFVLWSVGRLLELLLGTVSFVAVYLVAGLAGSLASLWWHPMVTSAGASGAIFGLFGSLLSFVLLHRKAIPGPILANLFKQGAGFVAINLLLGMALPNVDMAAHVGGLAGGLLAGLIVAQPLGRGALGSRFIRGIATAIVGCGAVAASIASMSAVPDVEGILNDVSEVEADCLEKHNAAVALSKQGELADDEFLWLVEREILPAWRGARKKLQALTESPHADGTLVSNLLEYFEMREEGWELFAKALSEPDGDKQQQLLELHFEKWDAAEALMHR